MMLAASISYMLVYGYIYYDLSNLPLVHYLPSLIVLVSAGFNLLLAMVIDNKVLLLTALAFTFIAAMQLP